MSTTAKGRKETAREPSDAPAVAPAVASAAGEWLRPLAQAATIGIFIIMFGVMLSLARGVLRPITAAIIVVIMLGPLARLAGRRVPPLLFAILVVVFIVLLIQFATVVVSGPIARLIEVLPTSGPVIAGKFAVFDPFLSGLQRLQEWVTSGSGSGALTVDLGAFLQTVAAYLTPALGELVVFVATLFLALVSRDNLRRNLILFFPDQEERLQVIQILNSLEVRLNQYIGTVTAINLSLGLVTALIAWLVGLPAPALFGLLAFIANYVPYIGAAVTLLSLFIAGLVLFPALTDALIAPAAFLAVATIEGQVITPSLIGQRITISPLAVFISLAFWIWLWGPVGGFLSVPFLIIATTVLTSMRDKPAPDIPG